MTKITTSTELQEAIRLLELERNSKLQAVKLEADIVIQNFKPENIIKHSLQNVIGDSNLKETLINGALGLVTGYLSKKVVLGGGDNNPIKNILGNLIQFGITSLVSKNADEIKSTGRSFIKSLLSKK